MQLTENRRKFANRKAASMAVFAFVGLPLLALVSTSPWFWKWVTHV